MIKIAIAGTGYVGLSNAVLLAQHNKVVALDLVAEKVELINQRQTPIEDSEIQEFLSNKSLSLQATLDKNEAYTDAEFVIVATPTNYDSHTIYFVTSSVKVVVWDVERFNPKARVVINFKFPVVLK